MAEISKKSINRRQFLKLAGMTGAAAALTACAEPTKPPEPPKPAAPAATAVPAVAMPLKGTSIKVYLQDLDIAKYWQSKLPDFEKLTGIKAEIEMVSFAVLLQQEEVELSSGSSNYDAMVNIFIKAQRWLRAGWVHPLDEFIAKDKYDFSDWIPATLQPHNMEGKQYALCYLAESTQMIYRKDLFDAAGLKAPDKFDDMAPAFDKIHKPPDLFAYVMRTQKAGVHFPFPIWLQGYGGNVFKDPPNDVTPTLNTPEALKAAEIFCDQIMKYSIGGGQVYDTPDCQNAMAQGKSAVWVDALGIFGPIYDKAKSTVADKVGITLVPGGPSGRFPQIASHALMIPKASKKKEAAWEFMKWALSKEMLMGAAIDSTHSACPRKSVLTSAEYAKKYNTPNMNIGELVSQALSLAKCAYRIEPEFPEIGERFGVALGEIISKQKSVKDAMDAAQKDAVTVMKNAGRKISG